MAHDISKDVIYYKFSEEKVPSVIRKVFAQKGWKEWDATHHDESLWSLHWKSGRFLLTDWDRCLPHQRLNHCPKASNITQKANLHRNIKRLAGSYGSIYNFVPTTYVLPNEYVNFMRECVEQVEPCIWIAKPADSSRGRGIFLLSDISELVYDQQYIIQRYIDNPLLIGGFKFDLRLYVYIPTFFPLRCYLFKEGLVRFATDKYSCDLKELHNVYAHLTNSSINKFSPSFHEDKNIIGAGCKWSLGRLRKYLSETLKLDDSAIFARIKSIIILTVLALWEKMPRQSKGFELFGFDVMIDSNLVPWLIEVNSSPAMGTDTPLDSEVKEALITDVLELLHLSPSPPPPDTSSSRGSSSVLINSAASAMREKQSEKLKPTPSSDGRGAWRSLKTQRSTPTSRPSDGAGAPSDAGLGAAAVPDGHEAEEPRRVGGAVEAEEPKIWKRQRAGMLPVLGSSRGSSSQSSGYGGKQPLPTAHRALHAMDEAAATWPSASCTHACEFKRDVITDEVRSTRRADVVLGEAASAVRTLSRDASNIRTALGGIGPSATARPGRTIKSTILQKGTPASPPSLRLGFRVQNLGFTTSRLSQSRVLLRVLPCAARVV